MNELIRKRSANKTSIKILISAVKARVLREALPLQHLPRPNHQLPVAHSPLRLRNYHLNRIAQHAVSSRAVPLGAGIRRRLIGLASADENPAICDTATTTTSKLAPHRVHELGDLRGGLVAEYVEQGRPQLACVDVVLPRLLLQYLDECRQRQRFARDVLQFLLDFRAQEAFES